MNLNRDLETGKILITIKRFCPCPERKAVLGSGSFAIQSVERQQNVNTLKLRYILRFFYENSYYYSLLRMTNADIRQYIFLDLIKLKFEFVNIP